MTMHNPNSGNNPGLSIDKTPHDKLMIAISICQMSVMAEDSALVPEKMWGAFIPTLALEHAVQMLIELLPVVENLPAQGVKA
jgi:hypothetical protein